jgi:hypothetical protein
MRDHDTETDIASGDVAVYDVAEQYGDPERVGAADLRATNQLNGDYAEIESGIRGSVGWSPCPGPRGGCARCIVPAEELSMDRDGPDRTRQGGEDLAGQRGGAAGSAFSVHGPGRPGCPRPSWWLHNEGLQARGLGKQYQASARWCGTPPSASETGRSGGPAGPQRRGQDHLLLHR